MPDNIKELFQHGLPFMVAASSGADKLNVTRMLEAVIIAVIVAAIVGAGAWFMIIPELKTEFKYVSEDVRELKQDIRGVQYEMSEMENRLDQILIDVVDDRFRRSDFDAYRRAHEAAHRGGGGGG